MMGVLLYVAHTLCLAARFVRARSRLPRTHFMQTPEFASLENTSYLSPSLKVNFHPFHYHHLFRNSVGGW